MKEWQVIVRGSGRFLPGDPIPNDDLIRRYGLETTDDWIVRNPGIHTRHFAHKTEAASHLAARASEFALEEAGVDAKDLDRIILCSSTPDWSSPAAASNLQRLLHAECPAEDKQTACASFLFGLDHGARLIATGANRVLVAAAEVKSRFVDRSDRRLAPIFADGGAAVILEKGDGSGGLEDVRLWTDGSRVMNMTTPAGGSAMPATLETVEQNLHTTRMHVDGWQIFQDAVETMTRLAETICAENGYSPADISWLIPHQANLQIMRKVAENLQIPENRVIKTIDHTGNIVSATIPYALDFGRKTGMIKPGELLLMVTVGAGYAGGASLYRVPA